MASAAVLHLPTYLLENPFDLRSAIHHAGQQALAEVVETLMDQGDDKDFQALSELLLKEGQKITAAILSTALKAKAEAVAKKAALCPSCGKPCKQHSQAPRTVESRHGEVTIERAYFYCEACKVGFTPCDQALNLAPQRKQYDLQAGAAQLLSRMPFDEAADVFKYFTGQSLSNHGMHDLASRLGEVARPEDVLPTRKTVEAVIEEYSAGKAWRPVLVVSADGAHTPTRPETGKRKGKRGPGSYQEAKGFRIYLVGQDRIEQIMSWHQIANEQEFGEALKFAATLIPSDKVRIGLIADGAPWIWSHFNAVFPDGKEILDYYHCSEHIHKFADIQYPDDENKQALWIEAAMARLFFGDVSGVIWGLQRMQLESVVAQKEAANLIGYLQNNEHRIDYSSAKRGQYPIGSGAMESANKFIAHKRMKVSGAWWYKINGNRMLRLRCAMYNGTFDDVFARYKRLQIVEAIKPPRVSRNS